MRLNLYGHPLAGLYWEKHCQNAIENAGFERIHGWECLYVHRTWQFFLSVYVDDFKCSGKKASVSKAWALIRSSFVPERGSNREAIEVLVLGDPEPMNRFLGCGHITHVKKTTWQGENLMTPPMPRS